MAGALLLPWRKCSHLARPCKISRNTVCSPRAARLLSKWKKIYRHSKKSPIFRDFFYFLSFSNYDPFFKKILCSVVLSYLLDRCSGYFMLSARVDVTGGRRV